MYYIEENSKIIFRDTDREKIENAILFLPGHDVSDIKETEKDIVNFEGQFYFEDDPVYIAKRDAQEQKRIQSLSMTRSDFFDGTIKAFGLDKNDLLPIISEMLNNSDLDSISKKIALNNFENAKDFYRIHPLFTTLADRLIPVGEGRYLQITSNQFDRFFDETNKKNPDAYKELLPNIQ